MIKNGDNHSIIKRDNWFKDPGVSHYDILLLEKYSIYNVRPFVFFFFLFFFFVISTPLNYLTSISKSNGVLLIAKTRLLFVSGKTADGTKRVSCCMLWYQHIWLRLSTFFFFPKATYCFLSLTTFCSIKRINMPLSALSVILFSSFSKEKKNEIGLLSFQQMTTDLLDSSRVLSDTEVPFSSFQMNMILPFSTTSYQAYSFLFSAERWFSINFPVKTTKLHKGQGNEEEGKSKCEKKKISKGKQKQKQKKRTFISSNEVLRLVKGTY